MIAPRWRKMLRDIGARPGRSLLAIAAMAAGVFALGVVVFKYAILQPALGTMYGDTIPAAATLVTDRVDDALIDSVRRVPGVGDAEARPVLLARARVGDDEWVPALLFVIRDFDGQRMDRFRPNDGAWPPADGEVLLERAALSVARTRTGGDLVVRMAGGDERTMRVSGTVHAPGLAPAWMEHIVYGFVPWTSVLRGADRGESAQIRIRVAEHPLDEGHVRETVAAVQAMLEARGRTVSRIDVPAPGRHPHADQMETFIYLIGAFGLLTFLLSAVLVAALIHSLLTEQVRQVGMMKAIGGTTRQIAGIYLGQVALLAAASLCAGVPAALFAGRQYARFSAGILNADVTDSPFPLWATAALVTVGILVPLAVALVPVRTAARNTVHRALHHDPGGRPLGSRVGRLLSSCTWLPRPLLLSLRTTFQRRGRLALTVATLAIGGAAFISARNVAGAWVHATDADFARRHFDVAVRLAEPQPAAVLAESLATIPAVAHAEFWSGATPYLIGANGAAGGAVTVLGVPPGSRLLDLPLVSGHWLRPDDPNGAVINQAIRARNPALAVGGEVRLRLDGRTIAFPIVGIVKEMFPMPVVYAPTAAVLAATGRSADEVRSIRIVTRDHTDAGQLAAAGELERLFERMGVEVTAMQRMRDARQGFLDHLVIIMTILTGAAVMVVIVGGLTLTAMLTIGVVQRTREIGILGALGATPRTIASHIWFESVLIGLLSWVVANVLAAPISYVLGAVTGRMFLRAPLDFHVTPGPSLLWLGLVLVLATISSILPAWRAARLTVREAIAHP